MFYTKRIVLLIWILALFLVGCKPVVSQFSDTDTEHVDLSDKPTPFISPSPLVTTVYPTQTQTLTPKPPLALKFPGLLAFLANTDYDGQLTPVRFDLFIMDANNQITRLTEGAVVTDFAWSPDGKKLLVSADLGKMNSPGNIDLYMLNMEDMILTPLPHGLKSDSIEDEVTWSPNGRKIAFSQYLGGESGLYVMDLDTEESIYLREGGAPSWSIDGENIVFVSRYSGEAVGDLYRIGADGSGLHELVSNYYVNKPVYSPDGKTIAFFGFDHNGQDPGIYVVQTDGTRLKRKANFGERPSWYSETQLLISRDNFIFTVDIDRGISETLVKLPENFYIIFAAIQPQIP